MLYAVPCPCGQTARGQRQRRHQVVPCAACGKPVFVLPDSAWAAAPTEAQAARTRWRAWRGPLLAGAVCLALVLAGFLLLLPHLNRPAPAAAGQPSREGVLAL